MEFTAYFCLAGRTSFTVDPKVNADDARFYFGRTDIAERLKQQLRRSFIDPGVPKMVIYGAYGSGKTQTLHYMQHHLSSGAVDTCRLKPRTVHLEIELRSKSDASQLHLQLMETLGMQVVQQWVTSLFDVVSDLPETLHQLFDDPNTANAANVLREGGDRSIQAWRWFTAQSLSNSELQALRLTRNLGQTGASDLAKALVGIGHLAERNGEKLIFFLDEAEQLSNVTNGDATESIHDYIRKLADSANAAVGVIIGNFAVTVDDVPNMTLGRPDVRSRIGEHNYIEIPYMPAAAEVREFVVELLAQLIDQPQAERRIHDENLAVTVETYPFTDEALSLFCQYASEDPRAALPRNIIKGLNECAIQTWDEDRKVVDEEVVNNIAPIVFG